MVWIRVGCALRKTLLGIVTLVLLLGTPAWGAWTHKQDGSWPPNGCYDANNNTQCTLGVNPTFPQPTTSGSTIVLGFGVQNYSQGQDLGQVKIVSAYTCSSGPPSMPCDPANNNVIDTFTIPVDPSGTHLCADYVDSHSVDCAYVISGTGGAIYLTINVTTVGSRWFPSMTEVKSSTGMQSLDAVGAAKNGTMTNTTWSGVAFSVSGTDDFVFQIVDAGSCSWPGDSCSITPSPMCSGQIYNGLFDDHYAAAYTLSTPCVTAPSAPTWACTGTTHCQDSDVVGAIAIKE